MPIVRLIQRRWGLIALLGLSVTSGVIALGVISLNYSTAAKSSTRAKNAILAVSELEGSLKDAETGQRGFLLTGDNDYLAPYIEGSGIAQANVAKLESLLKTTDTVSSKSLDDIRHFTSLKLNELEQTISLRRLRNLEAVLPIVQSGKGKGYMDIIRARSNRIRYAQESILGTNLAILDQLDTLRDSIILMIGIASSSIFLLLVQSFKEETSLRKQIVANQEAEIRTNEEAVKTLKEAADLKERELSLRIHDWKNPVTAVQSSMDLIYYYYKKQQLSNDNFEKHYQRIATAVATLLNGFDDALFVARAEAGKLDLNKHPADLVTTVRNSIAAVEAKATNHTIRLYQSDDAYQVMCDATLVQRAVINLLENAIKHTPSGEIGICLHKGANKTLIQVADQGEGIPPEDLQRLFSAFERGTTTATGTGLGLAVVKSCAEAHEGTVRVESQEGLKLAHPEGLTYRTMFTLAI
jgi:signal transduction histidine kinase